MLGEFKFRPVFRQFTGTGAPREMNTDWWGWVDNARPFGDVTEYVGSFGVKVHRHVVVVVGINSNHSTCSSTQELMNVSS